MKKKGQHPYSSKTDIEKKKPKNLTIDIDGLIIQEQTLLSAYKQNMYKVGKLTKKYLLLLLLLIQTTVFAQNKESKERRKKLDIVQWYFMSDLRDRGLRESVIEKCREELNENGLDILKPAYCEVQATFIDNSCDIESLLKGQCLDFHLDDGDHINYAWRINRKGKKWDLVILEIYEYVIKYSVSKEKDK